MGVTPTAPGYRRVRIAPKTFNLQWAAGTVPTQHGVISVSWRVLDGHLEISYDAPEECEVEVIAGDPSSFRRHSADTSSG
ncbi:MAG: hypothetical protein IPK19_17140 [Chloroflexi bacterium]|nr:hypothetical protein [Chloroflexota bacterium]